jgi:hypothetical protein
MEQRMKTEAEVTGFNLARLRKGVAFELFLRRLAQVAPDRWVLKGAVALDFRLDGASRSTKDIDLGRDDDEEAAIAEIAAAQRLRLDDFFAFTTSRTEAFDELDEFQAIRFHVRAELAERVFEQFIVDIGSRSRPARHQTGCAPRTFSPSQESSQTRRRSRPPRRENPAPARRFPKAARPTARVASRLWPPRRGGRA